MKQTMNNALGGSDDSGPKHRAVAEPEREQTCDRIHVFGIFYGQASTHRRRVMLDKNTKLGDVRQHLDPEASQPHTLDENDFKYCDSDLAEPLWRFSNSCALQVHYRLNDGSGARMVLSAATETLNKGVEAGSTLLSKAKDAAAGVASSTGAVIEVGSSLVASAKEAVIPPVASTGFVPGTTQPVAARSAAAGQASPTATTTTTTTGSDAS